MTTETSWLIAFIVCMIFLIIICILDSTKRIIIYPAYLFNFINKQIDDDFRTKQVNEDNILIDDDGLDPLSLEDLKKLRKEKHITLLYVRYSSKLESYLYGIFKQDYIIQCKKTNLSYNSGDFIVVKNFDNYYIREVIADKNKGEIQVYKPDGRDKTEYVYRMDVVGKIINYNKYRIGLA